jgi:hypothetical protein
MSFIRGAILSTALLATSSAFAGMFDRVPSESRNYCKDQVVNFFRNNIRSDFKITKTLKHKAAPGGRKGKEWIWTNVCSDTFLVTFHPKADCKSVHYGRVPRYVKSISADGDCRKLLPRTAYPSHWDIVKHGGKEDSAEQSYEMEESTDMDSPEMESADFDLTFTEDAE